MREKEETATNAPFIASELRPDVGVELERHPPVAPGVPREEIQRLAAEVFDEVELSRLGLADKPASSEIWQSRFTATTNVTCKVLDGEGVLLNLDSGFYYTLNRVGTVIWEMLAADQSLEGVVAAICERFDVEEKKARGDLVALVTHLFQEELITQKVERR